MEILSQRDIFFKSGFSSYQNIDSYYIGEAPPNDEDIIYSYRGFKTPALFGGSTADSDFILEIHGRTEPDSKEATQIVYATIANFKYRKNSQEWYTPIDTKLLPIVLLRMDSKMWVMQYHSETRLVIKKM